jgi:hypothetical protein
VKIHNVHLLLTRLLKPHLVQLKDVILAKLLSYIADRSLAKHSRRHSATEKFLLIFMVWLSTGKRLSKQLWPYLKLHYQAVMMMPHGIKPSRPFFLVTRKKKRRLYIILKRFHWLESVASYRLLLTSSVQRSLVPSKGCYLPCLLTVLQSMFIFCFCRVLYCYLPMLMVQI